MTNCTRIILLFAVILIPSTAYAQPSANIDENARTELTKLSEIYAKYPAYSSEGEIVIWAKSGGTIHSARLSTSFQFVKPNKLAVNFGTIATSSDGETMKVYDTIHRTFVTLSAPKQLVVVDQIPTPDSRALKGIYDAMSKASGDEVNDVRADAKTIGGRLIRSILIMLLDDSPVSELLQGATSVKLLENKPVGSTIKIVYRDGESIIWRIDPDTKQLAEMTLELGPNHLQALSEAKVDFESVQISWVPKAPVTDVEAATKLLNEHIKQFDADYKDFRALAALSGAGERAPVPTPENGTSFIQFVKHWLSKLWE